MSSLSHNKQQNSLSYTGLVKRKTTLVLPTRRCASAGTSYGHVSVSLSVTSWCSVEMAELIRLVSGMGASFELPYTVL